MPMETPTSVPAKAGADKAAAARTRQSDFIASGFVGDMAVLTLLRRRRCTAITRKCEQR
jgi:hypothetical protein